MGGKKGSGSLFYEPNRQFFPDGSHFRIFNEISLPAGLRLPPIHGALCFLIPLTCLPHRFPVNPLTPNDPYRSRTAPLTSKRCILYIYSTNIGTEYFKHGIYSPIFFSSICSLFHNSNVCGSCIIHILYAGCAKIKKKNNSDAKRLTDHSHTRLGLHLQQFFLKNLLTIFF